MLNRVPICYQDFICQQPSDNGIPINGGSSTSSSLSPQTGDGLGARLAPGEGDEAFVTTAEGNGCRVRRETNSDELDPG